MEVFGLILAIWVALLGVATLGHKGQQFTLWSWGIVTHPLKIIWSHYGSYVLILLVGVALGVCYAPFIRSLLGY